MTMEEYAQQCAVYFTVIKGAVKAIDEQREAGTINDDPFACPDCEAHMVKIGIDLYRCTRCGETFEATEVDE